MRNNVRYIDPGPSSGPGSGSLVYPAAGLGVVLDPVKGAQRFFRGHTDDITALAVYVPQSDGKRRNNLISLFFGCVLLFFQFFIAHTIFYQHVRP